MIMRYFNISLDWFNDSREKILVEKIMARIEIEVGITMREKN